MNFLDLIVDVSSILIRRYWQVTPVFLAYKTVVSLQLFRLNCRPRSILIRHYWQVTPVFLAWKTVLSLQLHIRRGKVLGTRAKKRGVGGRKMKSKRFLSPNPSWSRFLLSSAPCLKVQINHCCANYCTLFLLAIHARSQALQSHSPLLKKILIRCARFPPRNKEFLVVLES